MNVFKYKTHSQNIHWNSKQTNWRFQGVHKCNIGRIWVKPMFNFYTPWNHLKTSEWSFQEVKNIPKKVQNIQEIAALNYLTT